MPFNEDSNHDFDLQPDPRILPMLGEITLAPWQCIAEFIDNAVDGFMQASGTDRSIDNPEVLISIPASTSPDTRITITDNGPGMTADILEKAMRAGWSGNDPIHNLGLFGMGFNIATARMGTSTTVWTTTSGDREWRGLQIDFESLRRQGHFRTPLLTRPKTNELQSGTEVSVEKLKPDQREWFAKRGNQSQLRKKLGAIYAAMLRHDGNPISFKLVVNTTQVTGERHCIWNVDRTVTAGQLGSVHAYYDIDTQLPDRRFCTDCWQWLEIANSTTADFLTCGPDHNIVNRQRRVHGWIGLQRYLSRSDYGIDFLRNGRKLEIRNKDLFIWTSESDNPEIEYPIDDPRNRGRIVGEIHLDHCRVTYMKDRFDRSDPAWQDMVEIVRGLGPLRPDIAREKGYMSNGSALFRMFQAFRRSSPKPKVAGAYARLLIVPDNARAESMAKWFDDGHPEYQDDNEWWKLIDEADRALLTPNDTSNNGGNEGDLEGFPSTENGHGSGESDQPLDEPRDPTVRTPIASLTQEYIEDRTSQRWNVQAFALEPTTPLAEEDVHAAWTLRASASGIHEFEVRTNHEIFRSETLTPLDALLAELAHWAIDSQRNTTTQDEVRYAQILHSLRTRYAQAIALDPVELSSEATQAFVSIGRSLSRNVTSEDAEALFNHLREGEQNAIIQRMATRNVSNYQNIISEGGFLEYAPRTTIIRFIGDHADLFFDGRYWDDAYMSIDYGQQVATEEARAQVLRHYMSLLNDARWLADQEPDDLSQASRQRLLRASLSLDLLAPSSDDAP